MSNANHLLERIKGIRQFQPSAIRNSIVMWLLQLLSFLGLIGCIGGGIAVLVNSVEKRNGMSADDSMLLCLLLSLALMLMLILKLAKMVRRRNAYILELNEVLDGEEQVTTIDKKS